MAARGPTSGPPRGFVFAGFREAETGEASIARRPSAAPPTKNDGPRINEEINVSQVLLIDQTGEKRGVVPTKQAIEIAVAAGLDLVEVSPTTQPPVCKILDYGKFKYQQQKKKAEAKKKQKVVEIKEIKMRPNIDTHDYEVKTKAMRRFFDEGDKVKVTLRFRGREMAHQERGMELLQRVQADFDEIAKVEQMPKLEGRQMMMVMAPR
ncbi:MAG: translation initiation factor IF-3 [Alphaproteobacteria bacterium]|nr:translation initiation factor IF-3 [Alphaproteobacteria bacterium]